MENVHTRQRRLHAVLWLHIGTPMHSLAADGVGWCGTGVFDGVGLAGFKSRANASLLA